MYPLLISFNFIMPDPSGLGIILIPLSMYIVLIAKKACSLDRHWVERDTFVEANRVANEYEKDNIYQTRIFKADQVF